MPIKRPISQVNPTPPLGIPPSPDPLKIRLAALEILDATAQPHLTLDAALEGFHRRTQLTLHRDRALLQNIVFGVLRWRKRIDFIIGSFSRTPLKKIQPQILNILRIGTYQIVYLDRIPASAAVNTAVEMAKPLAPEWVVRFVNAVLRKVASDHRRVRFPKVDKDPAAALAVGKSFPEWLMRRWLDRFGLDDTVRLCDAVNTIPPITLRVNSLKIGRDALRDMLIQQGESARAASRAPDGILLSRPSKPLAEMTAYPLGLFQVQDEAAQLVSLLLNPQPGERILDACAGLGGKTGHIAQLMRNKGVVVASEISENKLTALATEMKRLGVAIVTTNKADLSYESAEDGSDGFDRVLLDAPCSGLGVLRRNPDAKWNASQQWLGRCSRRQKRLLDNLAGRVKPGGVLVYAVCSNEPEEGQAVVEHFLSHHDDFRLDPSADVDAVGDTVGIVQDGILSTYPHRHDMDGFFAARFRRL